MIAFSVLPLFLFYFVVSVSGFRFPSSPKQQQGVVGSWQKQKYDNHNHRIVTTAFSLASNDDNNNNSDDDEHPYEYDLAVIGAGPVGVQAAMLAASSSQAAGNNKKKKVVLIDAPRASGALMNEVTNEDLSIGGPTGLFSKALRDTSKRIRVTTLRGMGLREDSVWNEIVRSCVELAAFNARDINRQIEYAGVDLVNGYAKFGENSSHFLEVELPDSKEKKTVSTNKVLIATGSRPYQPENIPFDGKRVFDSDSINGLSFLPKSVAITGSGIVAIEYAKIFANLGCDDVTLLIRDTSPTKALIKTGLDKDVAATLVADIIRSGIKIERGCEVGAIDVPPSALSESDAARSYKFRDYDRATHVVPLKLYLKANGGIQNRPSPFRSELKCDAYIAAVGREANTDNLCLEEIGINLGEYGSIPVDDHLRAIGVEDNNVYCAGDVLGRPFLASTGVAQGLTAVRHMFPSINDIYEAAGGSKRSGTSSTGWSLLKSENAANDDDFDENKFTSSLAACDPSKLTGNPFAFPVAVWSSPEAAYYGVTVTQAKEMGIDADEGIALFCESLRGLVFSPNGLLKLVFKKGTGRIIGVHICGDDACELIHYGMELIKSRKTIADVADSMYSAVTYHELYRIAAQSCMDPKSARKRRAAAGRALAERTRKSIKSSA